jgi:glycosyltransferase involved in cell wall biosynthesis
MKCISIIIPFYKGEVFYPILIQSIKKAITLFNSNIIQFEIITVIDSVESQIEDVESILKSLKNIQNVKIIIENNNQNIGVAASRNVAISIATGDYLHIIDQDDEINEFFYTDVYQHLHDYSLVLVNGIVHYSDKKYNSHKLYYLTPNLSILGLLKGDFIRSPGQVIFSRKLLGDKLFPEPKRYKGADDRFFWIRLFIENEKIIQPQYINNTNYIAHIHNNNYSADASNLKRSALENWGIIRSEMNLEEYNRVIARDILRIKWGLKERLSWHEQLIGTWNTFIYFIEPNKLIRFVAKRKKW